MRLNLSLTPEQHAERLKGIGGSDARIIMNGSEGEQLTLWRLKRGEEQPEDLSHILPVAMGVWTEELNRHWFEQETGKEVFDAGNTMVSAKYPWMRATLDGAVLALGEKWVIFEAKHVNAWASMDDVVATYQPQLQHLMIVVGAEWSILSVFFGTQKYEYAEVPQDEFYCAELIERERAFWECVQNGTPPAFLSPVPSPAPPSEWRTVNMEGNNEWADHAWQFIQYEAEAKLWLSAKDGIKKLVAPDVGRAFGHGVEAKRSKIGAISIRRER